MFTEKLNPWRDCTLYRITSDGSIYLVANSGLQIYRTLYQNSPTNFLAITASQFSVHGFGSKSMHKLQGFEALNFISIRIVIIHKFLRNHCIIMLSPWNWFCIRIIIRLVQCMWAPARCYHACSDRHIDGRGPRPLGSISRSLCNKLLWAKTVMPAKNRF